MGERIKPISEQIKDWLDIERVDIDKIKYGEVSFEIRNGEVYGSDYNIKKRKGEVTDAKK